MLRVDRRVPRVDQTITKSTQTSTTSNQTSTKYYQTIFTSKLRKTWQVLRKELPCNNVQFNGRI